MHLNQDATDMQKFREIKRSTRAPRKKHLETVTEIMKQPNFSVN